MIIAIMFFFNLLLVCRIFCSTVTFGLELHRSFLNFKKVLTCIFPIDFPMEYFSNVIILLLEY